VLKVLLNPNQSCYINRGLQVSKAVMTCNVRRSCAMSTKWSWLCSPGSQWCEKLLRRWSMLLFLIVIIVIKQTNTHMPVNHIKNRATLSECQCIAFQFLLCVVEQIFLKWLRLGYWVQSW